MSLREHTVYFRSSTYEDLLHDASLLPILTSLETLCDTPFTHFRDLGAGSRQRPRRPIDAREGLDSVLEQGFHLGVRFLLSSCDPLSRERPELRLEVFSGAHPYTGNFHTALDARVAEDRFQDPDFTEAFVDWIRDTTRRTRPFVGHAHSSDDNSIQNIHNPGLLERGFGVTPDHPVDVATNPGREVSRGELRYAINWITLFGPAFTELLGAERFEALDPAIATRLLDDTWMIRLYPSPLDADTPEGRDLQRELWSALDFDAHLEEQSYALGYWDRKSRD